MASGDVATAVTLIVDTTKSALGLFAEWPLNIVVIAGIVGIGIGLVRGFIPKKRAR